MSSDFTRDLKNKFDINDPEPAGESSVRFLRVYTAFRVFSRKTYF